MRKNTNMRFCILIAILKDGQKINIILPVEEGQAIDKVNKPPSRIITSISSKSLVLCIIKDSTVKDLAFFREPTRGLPYGVSTGMGGL